MLDDTQARGKQLNLRLRSEEYNTLRERATESGLSVSEYARQAITNGKVEPRITPETMALVRRLCGMDNNLNQLARQANAAGFTQVNRECLRLTNQIGEVINELRK